jgi:hypothetical protein
MFGKLKDFVFTIEKTEDDKVQKPAPKAQVASTQPTTATMPFTASTVVGSAVNQEMLDMLMKSISEANISGFDYIEFRDSVAKMSSVPMTEEQKFIAVFSTAQTVGATLPVLISSVDHYIEVVNKQREGFLQNVKDVTVQEVDSRNAKIAESDAKIADANQKIADLNTFIIESQKQKEVLQNELVLQQQQINSTTSSFESTYNLVVGRLNEDKTKLTTYLGKV